MKWNPRAYISRIQSLQEREVLYGVTDRRSDPWLVKLNDFLIDHSPISLKEKSLFFDSLQLLVGAGVPFIRALEMLSGRTRNPRMKRVLATASYDMSNRGLSFSQALGKYPDIFPRSVVKMVLSGEMAGEIENTLESIAKQTRKNIELDIRVRSALLYPATVFAAIILAIVVMLVFVVPKFEVLFAQFSADLPWQTKLLISSSRFFQSYWWFVLTVGIALWMVFQNWKRSEDGQLAWDRFTLKIPNIGKLISNIQTLRLASNFSTLMGSGIPVIKALHILGDIIPNRAVGYAVFEVEEEVRQGIQIHASFATKPIFDPVIGEVIEIGEKGGQIPHVLQKLAEQYEMEVDAQLKNMTALIEPFVILVVGFAIVFMAMAIMLPIFRLQELFVAG